MLLGERPDDIAVRDSLLYVTEAANNGNVSVFPLTVTVQRIALEFAQQLGTDPDDVRPDEWKAMEL